MLHSPIQNKRPPRRWWSREDLLLLIFLGALFYLPGLGQTPLFDRDEPRFATAAREMLTSGDYIVPHFNGNLRPDKPPLVYWLMTLSYRAVGAVNELAARLPSALAAILTLLVVYFMVGKRFGRVTGLVASLILGSCSLFVVEARLSTADSTMIFFIVCAMACAWQAWDAASPHPGANLLRSDSLPNHSNGKPAHPLHHLPRPAPAKISLGVALLFWIALAAGTLTKGVPLFFILVPLVILSMTTGTLAAQARQWRSHLRVTGTRVGVALAVIVVTIALPLINLPFFTDKLGYLLFLGALVVAMILTPGLPGVLFRCFTGGNWGWWKQLRPLIGIPLLIALVAWWVIAADLQTNGKLIHDMVLVHFVARIGFLKDFLHIQIADPGGPGGNDAMASYSKPPGTYLVAVWLTFWPWSMLLLPAAFHAVRRVLGKTALAIDPRPYQFLLAWIIPMWILLEISRGKLLHYPLPLYVPIAIFCADSLVQAWHRLTDVFAAPWFAMARWVVLVIWLVLAGGVLVGGHLFLDPEMFWRTVPLAGALVAAGVAGAMSWNRPSWPFVGVLGWAVVLLIANTFLMPDLAPFFMGKQVGQAMAEIKKADPSLRLAAERFEEPTVVFYAGEKVEMATVDDKGNRVSMLDKIPWSPAPIPPDKHYLLAVDEATLNLLKQAKWNYTVVRPITGPTILNGRRATTTVTLITNVPPAATTPATAPQ